MSRIGILIETHENSVKPANFGVITAARATGKEIWAFVLNENAAALEEDLKAYGVSKLVNVKAQADALNARPDLQAAALISAFENFEITGALALSSNGVPRMR